jgi:hypothetical protein
MFGIDMSVKGPQETGKFFGGIALGDGDPSGMQKLFSEEGITNSWNLFQQLKLPPISQKQPTAAVRKQKKDDELFVLDPDLELSIDDFVKPKGRHALSSRKKSIQGISNEEFSRLLLERNYNFSLSR